MSEVSKFSSKDIKGWLEHETGSLFTPIRSKAQKLSEDMRKNLESLVDVSKMLLENSQKEIEKRNLKTYGRARALNKLARLFVDRLKQIKVPDTVTYDNFRGFVLETQKAFLVTDVDVRNWFPRVSPFFILDRRKFQLIFERSKELLKELDNFLAREYVKAKTLEETFQAIEKLRALEQQLASLKERKSKTEEERAQIERETIGIQQKMANIRSGGSLSQLDQLSTELQALNIEVRQNLQHLQKPFVKLQALALHGEGSGLTPEELGKLDQYIESPFEALATERISYPLLRQILQKLNRAMSEGRLKLKPEKTRKAGQAIESILARNSLEALHKRSTSIVMRRKQLSTSDEMVTIERILAELREQIEGLDRKKRVVEGEHVALDGTYSGTIEKIRNHRMQIEKNVFGFMNRRIQIE